MNAHGWLVAGLAALIAMAPRGARAQENGEVNDPRFQDLLLTVGKTYSTLGKVDDVFRFAPTLCSMPAPAPIRESASKDGGTHGQKLYFLYAWDAASYLKTPRTDHFKVRQTAPLYEGKPALQVLVKESWSCVKVEEKDRESAKESRDPGSKSIVKNGEPFKAGEMKGLFIMVKLDEAAGGTDRGWVYGTVTEDQKRVTSAGRVKSCMACHESAGDGRLFGLPEAKSSGKPKGEN
jgi:hypothetical protein